MLITETVVRYIVALNYNMRMKKIVLREEACDG